MQAQPSDRWLIWKVFGVVMVGALIGGLGILPYAMVLLGPAIAASPTPLALILAAQVIQALVLAAVFAGLGLWLGGKIGLGAPVLRAWLAGSPDASTRFQALLAPSILAGVASGVAIIVLELAIFAPQLPGNLDMTAATSPTPWQGFLASFYGGINEEILMRLGLMTIIAWIGTRLTRSDRPSSAVMWIAIVAVAVVFGLGHLPATAANMPLTALVVIRALVLNGLAGVVFGWLYWQRGLLAAMVAHFSADIVLHVLAPLLAGLGAWPG